MNDSPFLSMDCPCDAVLQQTHQQLRRAGLRTLQTFDLQAARSGSLDCRCPQHESNECQCQMVVVLVYGEVPEPVTLILHGDDRHTWLSIVDAARPGLQDGLVSAIQEALRGAASVGS